MRATIAVLLVVASAGSAAYLGIPPIGSVNPAPVRTARGATAAKVSTTVPKKGVGLPMGGGMYWSMAKPTDSPRRRALSTAGRVRGW